MIAYQRRKSSRSLCTQQENMWNKMIRLLKRIRIEIRKRRREEKEEKKSMLNSLSYIEGNIWLGVSVSACACVLVY